LAFPVTEQFVNDVDDAFVLKEIVVAVVLEETEPGFDDQPVTGKAAVGAKPGDIGDVTEEGPQGRAR